MAKMGEVEGWLIEEVLLQSAVFRGKRKAFKLKKLERTAALAVLSNFFFGLIFQNSIL